MLSKQQQKDSDECTRMMESGEGDKDCAECSCSVCLAQVSTGYNAKRVNFTVSNLTDEANRLLEKYKEADTNTQLANLCDKMATFCEHVISNLEEMVKGE